MPSNSHLVISCEFFPPRTEQGVSNLRQTRERLQILTPTFFSVTFGAGGSTQDKTVETVVEIQRSTIQAAPHISCIASTSDDILHLLRTYQQQGITRLVALRGDKPSGLMGSVGELNYANELVTFIREKTGQHFYIEVAAYPEFHPQAHNAQADLDHFKQKVQAGANGAITQYFYNADAYLRFIDSCQRLNIEIPIVPGIMPITNYVQLARFSEVCGAEIPRWLHYRLKDLENDVKALSDFGADVVARLCEQLLAGGAPGLHFYTLNRAEPTLEIAKRLGII